MTLAYMISALVVLGLQFAFASPHTNLVARGGVGSSCSYFTLAQAQQLSGWPKFQKFATDTFGSGSMRFAFNLPQYPDAPATLCLDEKPITVTADDKNVTCSQSTSVIYGTMNGTTGTMSLSYQMGYSNTGSWTVQRESSLAVGVSLTATIRIPMADFSSSLGTTTTLTNSLATSFTTTYSDVQTSTVTVNIPEGKNCSLPVTTNVCSVNGTGAANYTLSGWVWFIYDDWRAPISDPNASKHSLWAFKISSILDADELSSSMQFSGNMEMTNLKTNFSTNCS